MRAITLLLTILFIGINHLSFAATIQGKINNANGEAIADANIVLQLGSDSSIQKLTLTNDSGHFEFSDIKKGVYFIKVIASGYIKYSSANFVLDSNIYLPAIAMRTDNRNLKEVDIVVRKPLIENKPGKLIVNVDALLSNAGKTAFEVLEQSPSISIDNNNTIRMRGKAGVIVYIDGKLSPLQGDDLANYLKALPSQAIERIELITQPSAKYDAAGNAGIINIVMKKDKRLGTNGTVALSVGQGRYYKTGEGISINNRNKKMNVFGSYNFGARKGFNDLDLYRKFYANDTFQGAYKQFNGLTFPINTHQLRGGIDFNLNRNTLVGFVISGARTAFKPMGLNSTTVMNSQELPESKFSTVNNSSERWGNASANFNFKHTIDTLGTEITADIDYAEYRNTSEQHFNTQYFALDGSSLKNPYILLGNIGGRLQIKSAKVDYTHPFKNGARMEAGAKASDVRADNDLKFYDQSNGVNIFDSTKSNHFIYSEKINAAYINYTTVIKKLNIQLGLRGEQTRTQGTQIINGNRFTNKYIQLFPNIAIDHEFSKVYSAGITLSRRIDRPSYEQLNPFKFFLDPTTYKEGNPFLLPQLSYNIEFSQTFNQRITATLSYSNTQRLITEVLVPAEFASNITIQTNVNLLRYDYYGASISAPLQLTSWWTSINNANVYYGYYRGELANTKLSNGSAAFDLNSINSFTLPKNWTAEMNLFYTSPQVYAYILARESWQLGIGIQKSFNDRKGTIKLSASDLFWTGGSAGESSFRDFNEVYKVKRETRAAFLTLTYKLGKTTVAPSRRRAGSAEEEKQRANKSGN